MKIEVVLKNVKNEAPVREFVEQKVQSALDRIEQRVDRVTVRLEDESRSSEAFDGLCHIDAKLSPTGQIHVSAHGESAFDTVAQGVKKLEHAIKHDIDRHRRSSRVRHKKNKQEFYSTLEKNDDSEISDETMQFENE